MKMLVYDGPENPDSMPAQVGEYEFKVNPETYSKRFQIDETPTAAAGDRSKPPVFNGRPPAEWGFDIIIDGTGVIKNASLLDITLLGQTEALNVEAEVTLLKDMLVTVNGDTHQTNYVKIMWGDTNEIFKGKVVSLDLQYKLFKTDGTPLRVIAKLKLREHVQQAEDPLSSPDITHAHIFKAEDKFYLLAQKYYRTPGYYFDVAQKNGLDSFRKIKIGTELKFYALK
ncbi:MAG: hypothetical protein ACKVPJ_09040 [Chitinophagales bacterium]